MKNIADYADAAVILREAADQLIERLDLVLLTPRNIMETGCKIGYSATQLKKRYPSATIFSPLSRAELLSIGDQTIDLVMANLVLVEHPSLETLQAFFQEVHRILIPNGLFMFSSLGPDTLSEIPREYQSLKKAAFIDMHDIGDTLVKTHFSDPVLDVEYIVLTYNEQQKLQHDLYLTGYINQREIPLLLQKTAENQFELTYEIIYGHAWGTNNPLLSSTDEDGTIAIPFSALRKQLLGR